MILREMILISEVKFLEPCQIKEKVDEVLQEANKQGFYNFNSPTDLYLIAEKICGLNIFFENLDKELMGVVGLIDLETKAIWLNESLLYEEGRCNFTIAHEIGHYFLHKNLFEKESLLEFHDELTWQARWIETQANMFAAMLLMPSELIYKKWNKDFNHIINLNNRVTAMTEFFKTSREAMMKRLDTLNLLK